jgi:DNA-binding NarL/FixJ family response regulator
MMTDKNPVILTEDLTKVYQMGDVEVHALRGLSMTIEAGEVVAITFIIIDITSKKQAALEQREYLKQLSKKLNIASGLDKQIDIQNEEITIRVKLTARETQVLKLMAEGQTNMEISSVLMISPNTVKSHVTGIFNKLGVNDRTQAAVLATRFKLI